MRASKSVSLPEYTIFMDGRAHRGTAQGLLDMIRGYAAKRSKEIAKLSTTEYAATIIGDAASYLDADFLSYLKKEHYVTDFDRALRYLSEMEASGVKILSRQEATA